MLELANGLSLRALEAIADLEKQVIAVDGGRLKLEWATLRGRAGDRFEDLLWWEGERLLGFLGLYSFGTSVELSGMVDPTARRRGIATSLLDAALPLCRGYTKRLLVTPRGSVGGAAFAHRRGAVLEHSEHALVLIGPPRASARGPDLSLRVATPSDVPAIERLLDEAFHFDAADVAARLATDHARTLVVEQEGAVIGTVRVTRDGDAGGIYGFAIDARFRGKGIGREVLRRACTELHDEGFARVGLEVAVENEHALGLYTSVGFERVTTEDYYAV